MFKSAHFPKLENHDCQLTNHVQAQTTKEKTNLNFTFEYILHNNMVLIGFLVRVLSTAYFYKVKTKFGFECRNNFAET